MNAEAVGNYRVIEFSRMKRKVQVEEVLIEIGLGGLGGSGGSTAPSIRFIR